MRDLLAAELRSALRGLKRSPGFALVAMLTLALGIGASTALFSVVSGVLLRPLDYRDATRLVAFRVERTFAGRPQPVPANFSLPSFDVWQSLARSLESVAMYRNDGAQLTGDNGNERIPVADVTPSFFSTVGGRFVLGRGLAPGDDNSPVVVVSRRLWQRILGGSPTALGAQILVDRQPYAIVGVADRTFQLPNEDTDVWRPIGFVRTLNPRIAEPRAGGFNVIARLRAGATLAQAQADAVAVCRSLDPLLRPAAAPLRDWLVTGTVRPTLFVLLAAVSLVLLVACANVANLLFARNAARTRETAIRLALGTSRARLLLQSAVQGGVIAAGGAAGGVLLAAALSSGLVLLNPAGLPRLDAVHIDAPVLLFAAFLATLSTLLVSVAPVVQPVDVAEALKAGGGAHTASRRVHRIRTLLVVAELTVSVVLLVGASVLGRSLVRLLQTDLGVSTDHVTAALVELSSGRSLPMAEQRRLIETTVAHVRALPGVQAAGAGASLPPNMARLRFTMRQFDDVPGRPENYMVDAVTATPEFFSTLRVRLRQGRWFEAGDDGSHRDVMIVSANTAKQLFADANPIGSTLTLPILRDGGSAAGPVTLVGIVDEVKYAGLDATANPVIYRPFAQQPWSSMFIVARTGTDVPGFAATLRREISAVDSGIGIQLIDTLDGLVANAASQPRFRTLTLGALSLLAVSLAAVGLYGLIAYTVTERTPELGIRMALGAGRPDVIGLVMRQGLTLSAAGIVFGLVSAAALSRLLTGFLYGVQPLDAPSYLAAGALLFVVSAAASYVPARRASRIDPIVALRGD